MVHDKPFLNTKIINNAVYEIIPTEKGYSYVICVSLCLSMMALYGHFSCLGMMYNDFLEDIGAGVSGLTFMLGVNCAFVALSGMLTNIALKKFSIRQVGLFGASMYFSGWVLTTFVQNLGQMIFTFGCLIGMSTGIVFTIAFTSFNFYFVTQKKVMIMNTCQLIISSYAVVFPFILEYLLEEYGYRGTQLIMAGIMGHTIFSIICMHPIEWHADKKLLYQTVKDRDNSENTLLVDSKTYELKTKFTVEKVVDPSAEYGLKGDNTRIEPTSKFKSVVDFLDLSMLKDMVFVNLLIGLVFGMMIDVMFFSIFPSYMYDVGLNTATVAKCLSILGASDLAGRACLVIITKYYIIRSEIIFYFGILFSTITRIGFFFCRTPFTFHMITAILGFFRALILSPYVLVYADYAGDKFPAAMGLGMLTYGFLSLPLMSFIGFLYETTGSHIVGYMFLTGLNTITLTTWTIKLWYFRNK